MRKERNSSATRAILLKPMRTSVTNDVAARRITCVGMCVDVKGRRFSCVVSDDRRLGSVGA